MNIPRLSTVLAISLLLTSSLHARDGSVSELVRRREAAVRQEKTREWQAIDAQLRAMPAPVDPEMALRIIGRWHSPRHDYLYRADGTWVMLPQEADATSGSWKIKGNQLIERTGKYTIILLDRHDLVYTDGESVFYLTRLGR